jgi:hypothetical protein
VTDPVSWLQIEKGWISRAVARVSALPDARPQRSQLAVGQAHKWKTLGGCAAVPLSPSETPSRPAPSSRSTFPNSGKYGGCRRRRKPRRQD